MLVLRNGAALPWRRRAAAAIALLLLIPNSSVLEHRAVVAVFLLALATGRGRQFVRDWIPLVATAAAFVFLRQLAVASPFPRAGADVVRLEMALFGGELPTTWLQQRLYVPGDSSLLDYAATAVHASYFFGFVVVGLGVWLLARSKIRLYTRGLALTFALGLAGYVLVPTEPPWLAAREGLGPPAARITVETTQRTQLTAGMVATGRAWQGDPDALGDPNPSAAMPSVHTAITVALALYLARVHPALGAFGWTYTLAMGFSLVYLGEHYVLDVVAGAACAAVAHRLARSEQWNDRVYRWRSAIARALRPARPVRGDLAPRGAGNV
ncbi:MAG: phosphatase PAP2 family protein [Chloroflexi bacterium]|nr:phosphatase PAP2 family protein [Chloroflexota bacterium]